MKRAALAIVSTVASLVMLLSFKTHTQSMAATPPAAVSSADESSSSGSTGSSPTGATQTYTGTAAATRYGPVQVQITVDNGTITDVTAVEYPDSNPRDEQINAYAIPALNREALRAGSSDIDMISGATYTSQGYISSLQSALDEAGL